MSGIQNLAQHIYKTKYQGNKGSLCRDKIRDFAGHLLSTLFPQMGMRKFKNAQEIQKHLEQSRDELFDLINCLDIDLKQSGLSLEKLETEFFGSLIEIENMLLKDAEFISKEDPAAESYDEVIMCYPGFRAIAIYRIAHKFYELNIPLFPRVLTELAHEQTGIDIHPGAKIQSPFFIDHGTGIVIGETTTIGKEVKIFQGVTLGALSVERKFKNEKRHPSVEDGVVIYSNASILGGKTNIGKNSIIGGNVWLTESVPENTMVYHRSETKMISKDD